MTARYMHSQAISLVAAGLASCAITLSGCYAPDGAIMNYTGQASTYESNEWQQKTVTVVDVRTEQPIFSMTVPPGKWLIIQFDKGGGNDPVHAPDLMRYEVKSKNSRTGMLANSLSVPNSASRRVDVDVTQARAFVPAEPPPAVRADEKNGADGQ